MHNFHKVLPEDALGGAGDTALPVIPLDPVPRERARRNGWSGERQRAFIATLATCGSVSAAARSVGLTARTAYRLCDAPGATRPRARTRRQCDLWDLSWQPLRGQGAKRP